MPTEEEVQMQEALDLQEQQELEPGVSVAAPVTAAPVAAAPVQKAVAAPTNTQAAGTDGAFAFDAKGYMDENDMHLVGPGDKDGEVIVVKDGEEQIFSVNKLLDDLGAKGAEVILNTPETALQTSPVGFVDRMKLSFGDAKGNVNYLKKNYQEATMVDGSLFVKDKGIWHTVDPTNLGNGEGWDIAGDIADLSRDAVMTVGQVTGAAVGTAAGLGVGSVPGAVVGSAVGSGIASGASVALGRFLGTYEATDAEIAKDIALDTLIGAGGEFVALGAKNTVFPKLKRAATYISEKASPVVKDLMSKYVSVQTGISTTFTDELITNPKAVTAAMQGIKAAASETAEGATDNSIKRIAAKRSSDALESILEGAQPALSKEWEAGVTNIIEDVAENASINLNKAVGNMHKGMQEAGFMKFRPGKDGSGGLVPLSAKELVAEFEFSPNTAKRISKSVGDFFESTSASRINNNKAGDLVVYGKEGAKRGLELVQQYKNLYYDTLGKVDFTKNKTAKDALEASMKGFGNEMAEAIGPNVSGKIVNMNKNYRLGKIQVNEAERLLETVGAKDTFLSQYFSDPAKHMERKELIGALATRKGPGAAGAVKHLNVLGTAGNFASLLPKEANALSLRTAGAAAAGYAMGPVGLVAGVVAQSPRLNLYGVNMGHKIASKFSSVLKSASQSTRLQMLNNPEAMAAMLSEVARGYNDPKAPN